MIIDSRICAYSMMSFLKKRYGDILNGKILGIFTSSDPGARMYLKYIKKDAKDLGVNIVELGKDSEKIDADGFLFQYPIEYDLPDWANRIQHSDKDLDTMYAFGCPNLPLASMAVLYMLWQKYGSVEKSKIVIIGRGNAVKGLDKVLTGEHNHITVCHSKTPRNEAISAISQADVVIYAAPKFDMDDVQIPDGCFLFDLTGSINKSTAEHSEYTLVTNLGSATRFHLFLNLKMHCENKE